MPDPQPQNPTPTGGPVSSAGSPKGGLTLWQYTADGWAVKKSEPEPGYQQGPPPREPGRFVGELRRTPCVPAKSGA